MARGAVGPVHVLDHEQHGPLLAERLEQGQERLKHARLLRVPGPGRGTEAGHDGCEVFALGGRERRERFVAGANQRTQRGHERRVGELALAELHAVAGQDARAALARPGGELLDQPGLAYTRLTRYERERRVRGGGVRERGSQLDELLAASHEARAGHPGGHVTILPPGARRRGCGAPAR